MRRVGVALVALLLVISGLVAGSAPKAQAAFVCGATGELGSPKIVSLGGDSNPITLYDSSGRKRQVYYGHPQYFCPSKVHVNFNRTVYVYCNQANPIFWYTSWGTHAMKTYCRAFHSSLIKFGENR